ncbi:MAG: TlpA family protein disulfide reductase [Lewinellaceae bacterium]|nr:TlpA family protein disulfide reductase [Lewinellaceae bacterium]
MRLILPLSILLIGWHSPECVIAQPGDASAIIQQLNTKLETIERGVFDLNIQFKSAPIEDTASFFGKVYFFKNYDDPYGIAHFIFWYENEPICVYDDDFLFRIDHAQKAITLTNTEQYHPYDLVQGSLFLNIGLYRPYLKIKGPAFDLAKFESWQVDTLPDQRSVLLSYVETYVNDLKINPSDPDTGRHITQYEISLSDYGLHSITEWDYFLQTPQYYRIEFSAIRPLPEDSTLKNTIGWVSLFESGYSIKYYDPNTDDAEPEEQSAVNSTTILPTFALLNLDSSITQSADLNKGLLLLDFWYRACFPCLKAMPALEQLHQTYAKNGLTVIGINPYDKDVEALKKFLNDRQISYPMLLDNEHTLAEQLNINTYPTLLLVDAASKKILYVQTGFGEADEATLDKLIRSYLEN